MSKPKAMKAWRALNFEIEQRVVKEKCQSIVNRSKTLKGANHSDCENKMRFGTASQANDFAAVRHYRGRQTSYYCRIHDCWHITGAGE